MKEFVDNEESKYNYDEEFKTNYNELIKKWTATKPKNKVQLIGTLKGLRSRKLGEYAKTNLYKSRTNPLNTEIARQLEAKSFTKLNGGASKTSSTSRFRTTRKVRSE